MTKPCCNNPDTRLLSDEGYECLNCGMVHGHRMPVFSMPAKCEVAFCDRGQHTPHTVCKNHRGVNTTGLAFDVIGDPETGDDAYLYSGVEYKVKWYTQRACGEFIGTFVHDHPYRWRVMFVDENGGVLDIAKDAIRDIVAL